MAAAAAIAGLIKWVRDPGPCRPSKLRLVVDAQRRPGATMSPFSPQHIEQPGAPHSKPDSMNILSRPRDSASRWMLTDPRHDQSRYRCFVSGLVEKHSVDMQQVRTVGLFGNQVLGPNLLDECLGCMRVNGHNGSLVNRDSCVRAKTQGFSQQRLQMCYALFAFTGIIRVHHQRTGLVATAA